MLDWERLQSARYEYVGGILRAMVGGSLAHNRIALNIAATLRARLAGGPCRPFMENAKVVTAEAFLYPDVVVTCSPIDPTADTVPEPVAIVEVLSRTTADYDSGAKWLACQTLPSLRHFVLVAQDRRFVAIYSRAGADWRYRALEEPDAVLALEAIDAEISLADIYSDSGI
ncbi:MAG: Uma2 family endonuclease [Gammaproteobacteria bacterium]|jgi:Uma2 family endonuclease|nr:Uma2 family endonuclease [Gammaproteobacteria bacterium]